MSTGLVSQRAALAIADLLDKCAQVQPGQHVVLLAALDGLCGGRNIVDEQAISWIQAGVQQRGAYATVIWADVPLHPDVYWNRTSDALPVWHLPPVVEGAIKCADIVIGHLVDLWTEGEVVGVLDVLRERNVPYVFNMATTAPLLASAFCLTPWELAAEIRVQAAKFAPAGSRWVVTHANGTHLEGTIVRGGDNTVVRHTKFPEGVFPILVSKGVEGELIYESTGPHWARHIGMPREFSEPVRITIEQGRMKEIRGGVEAETLREFFKALSKHLGDDAYTIRGLHGGCHPHAQVSERECPDAGYRAFISHHNASNVHVHLGDNKDHPNYPFTLHISAELPGATLKVEDHVIFDAGRMPAFDHPEVQKIVARYPDRPGTHDVGSWAG
jgi:hypothetical protein